MALKVYDPKDVTVIFGPTGQITGYADGTFVTIEKNEEAFALQVGTDGEGTRSKSNNQSGRITISLMQSSASNDILSTIHTADLEVGTGVFPLLVKDLQGNSIFEASQAWITSFPSSEYGREAAAREWVIETDQLIMFPGGNDDPLPGAI
jgi:hypothetical protein